MANIISAEIIHPKIIESVIGKFPMENTTAGDALTPPPCPEQWANSGVSTANTAAAPSKQFSDVSLTPTQKKNILRETCKQITNKTTGLHAKGAISNFYL
jgi:hypothetical protein